MGHASERTREPSDGDREAGIACATVEYGDLEIDEGARRASLHGRPLDLTDGEFALLLHLTQRPNRLVTRVELLAKVWSTPWHTGSNLVDVVVCRLRRRLGSCGRMIETVRGLGYRFRAPEPADASGMVTLPPHALSEPREKSIGGR